MMADEGNMIGNDELTSGAGASHDEDRGNQHKIHRPKGYGIDNEEGLVSQGKDGCGAQQRLYAGFKGFMGYKVYDMRVKHYERLRGEIGRRHGCR